MTSEQRVNAALELGRQAFTRLREWAEEPDPVAKRRLQAEAVTLYRSAADVLDERLQGELV